MTSQETGIKLSYLNEVNKCEDGLEAFYTEVLQSEYLGLKAEEFKTGAYKFLKTKF